jgi:hypothetical protein
MAQQHACVDVDACAGAALFESLEDSPFMRKQARRGAAVARAHARPAA